MIAQIFNPTAGHEMPAQRQTYEANAEIEIQLLIVEAKISKCST